jgi:hypothetical protein
MAGRTNVWYHANRAYARARESFRRSKHKLSGELRLSDLRRKGMNQDVYAAMLTEQKGRCAICYTTKPSPRRDYFDIDHDHTTGQIRGLLCEVCNRAIGLLKDDPKRFRRATEYLEHHAASLPLWVVATPKPRRKYR